MMKIIWGVSELCLFFIFTAPKWFWKLSQVHTLTMHTAYERKDNESPAGVTALCIAR